MKKKNLIINILVFSLVIAGGTLAYIFKPEQEQEIPHEHTFKESWSSDNYSHWHDASCEHTNITSNLESHIDSNNDYKCDVCNYELQIPEKPHEHTFKESWTSDNYSHWHEATCEHSYLIKDKESHIFNSEGYCIICNHETLEHYKTFTFIGENCHAEANSSYHLNDEITLKISPNEGYEYPNTIKIIKGLNKVNYDKNTGLVKGTVIDDIIIQAKSVYKIGNYYLSNRLIVNNESNEEYHLESSYDLENKEVTINDYNLNNNVSDYKRKEIYKYNENNLIESLTTYRDEEFYSKIIYIYNEDNIIIEEQEYRIIETQYHIYQVKVYQYDEHNKVDKIYYYYDLEKEDIIGIEEFTYIDDYYIMNRMKYVNGNFEKINMTKQKTVFDYENKTKTITSYNYRGDNFSEERLNKEETIDLLTNKIVKTKTLYEENNYKYNDNNDIEIIKGLNIDSSPNEETLEIKYEYDENSLLTEVKQDYVFRSTYYKNYTKIVFTSYDNHLLKEGYVTHSIYPENTSNIYFEYVKLEDNIWVPDSLTKGYSIGNYPDFILDSSIYTYIW